MSAYNFQRRFSAAIKSGEKRSTIRARRKNGYVPAGGESVRLYTGMRTKSCELIKEVTIHNVRPITVNCEKGQRIQVILDCKPLTTFETQALAIAEGFSDLTDMREFFERQYGEMLNAYFIEW